MKPNTYALTTEEKAVLRKNGVKLKAVAAYNVPELKMMLGVSETRAKEIYALSEFQTVPSIGIKFAEDLISIGYYSLAHLRHKDGATLIDELELSEGVWIDPCVEDQCRLVVHYANHKDPTKSWWHFTAERKAYRAQHGYPASRPSKPWHESLEYKKG